MLKPVFKIYLFLFNSTNVIRAQTHNFAVFYAICLCCTLNRLETRQLIYIMQYTATHNCGIALMFDATVFCLSNPFRVWLFWGNPQKYLHFLLFLDMRDDTDRWISSACERHGTLYRAWSIAGNLMTWWWCGALMVPLMLVGTIELPVIWDANALIWNHCNDRQKYTALQWRHNGPHGVPNHQPHHCLLKRSFGRRSKKTSKLRVTAFVRGIHRGPVNSPHKGPVTRKMFPFDDVIMV